MSGSQIGGAVGAVAGAIVGFYTGNIATGAKWGYAIGSAIGGYVDPTKTSGPRIEDAQAQTSTVGGLIPFGYGVFTCAGNIIWTDRLIEHKKTERVGKGGSQKNTTYTYTRSYAIGVCEGPISGYLWIKRNGKLVYAADPAALGAAMGWGSKQISDLVASSNKFLQMATLYSGTSAQMPDSTIVAVEGVGNVSPHRDLAYIVLENEDLTDMQGAVSQYEFCVQRGAAKSYTTPPYPIETSDRVGVLFSPSDGGLVQFPNDDIVVSVEWLDGSLRDIVQKLDTGPDEVTISPIQPLEGTITGIVVHKVTTGEDVLISTVIPMEGTIVDTIIQYKNFQPDVVDISMIQPIDGSLS